MPSQASASAGANSQSFLSLLDVDQQANIELPKISGSYEVPVRCTFHVSGLPRPEYRPVFPSVQAYMHGWQVTC